MISCVLLSAGLSSRFGSPKALAHLNSQMVIEYIQATLLASKVFEIIVVLGDRADQIKPFLFNHKKIKFVYNKDYILGQTFSFKAGLENISSDAAGVMLFPVDYPLVRTETVDALVTSFKQKMPLVIVPSYRGKRGHPPIFDIALKKEFLSLAYTEGINTVIHQHPRDTLVLPVDDPGVVRSFNTPEEFQRVLFPSAP